MQQNIETITKTTKEEEKIKIETKGTAHLSLSYTKLTTANNKKRKKKLKKK